MAQGDITSMSDLGKIEIPNKSAWFGSIDDVSVSIDSSPLFSACQAIGQFR